ncbi:ABC transporter substrate-binding protein [Paenibacillus chartarius]|uniref:ABC transporter substrate-binding protein n=1 Tax=Paenibacillus chartarius TaxID=747481 RepID=A0ABV6DHY0_9BACL
MIKNVRLAASIIILSALLVGVLGCSPGAGPQPASRPNAESKQVTLRFVWWGGEQRKEATLKAIDLYQKKYPNVKIEPQAYTSYLDLARDLTISTAEQQMPDLIQGDYSFIFNYINRKLLEPLNPYVEAKTLNLSDVEPLYLAPGKDKDGQLYAVNLGNNVQAFMYNADLLAKYKVQVPKEGYTIDDLYATLKELKTKVKTPGFVPLGSMIDPVYYMRAKGKSLYSTDGTSLGYDNDRIMTDYFATYQKWRSEGLVGDLLISTPVANDKNHPLLTGKHAFLTLYSNMVGPLNDFGIAKLKMLALPKIDSNQEGHYIKPSMFISVSSYSKHKEEAVKFIDFITNDLEANSILNAERGVPISKKVYDELLKKADDGRKEAFTFVDYIKTRSKPIDPPAPRAATTISNVFNIQFLAVGSNALTPEQAAQTYRESANQIFADEKVSNEP